MRIKYVISNGKVIKLYILASNLFEKVSRKICNISSKNLVKMSVEMNPLEIQMIKELFMHQ